MYWNDLTEAERRELTISSWMSHPEVRRYINEQVSGNPDRWALDWFQERYAARLPISSAVVVGCGTGELERDLARRSIANRLLAIDVAPAVVAAAQTLTAQAGLEDRISYWAGDARAWVARQPPSSIPAIFFHASMHHFDRIPELIELLRDRLLPGGLLYLDEYVGPSMSHWSAMRLIPANVAYYLLPRGSRRPRLVRAPINPDDPTEAVCSAEILPAIARSFSILDRRDYGGNLLSLIYPNLRRDDLSGVPSAAAVHRLIRLETFLRKSTAHWFPPFHSAIVASPRVT